MVSHKDPKVISQILSDNMLSCSEWLTDNRVSLHLGKTECILFGSHSKLQKVSVFSVTVRDEVIKASNCVKYLGLKLDQALSGCDIVSNILRKANAQLRP